MFFAVFTSLFPKVYSPSDPKLTCLSFRISSAFCFHPSNPRFQAQIEKAALLKKLKRKPGDPAAAAAEEANLTPAQQEQRAAAAAAAEAASGTRSDQRGKL